MPTFKEFIETVQAMRFWQKEYFATRSLQALENSKLAERKVDKDIDAMTNRQKSLFPAEVQDGK